MGVFDLQGLTQNMANNKEANDNIGSYFLDVSMSNEDFKDVFFFKASTFEDINTSSTKFYVEAKKWPKICFSNGIVNNNKRRDVNNFNVDRTMKTIGPAWLASNITGGYKKSDIFENEGDLIQEYINMDDDEVSHKGIKQLIQNKLKESGTREIPLSYNDDGVNNISKEIIDYYLKSKSPVFLNRLFKMMKKNEWSPLTFEKGDVIKFGLVYNIQTLQNLNNRSIENQDFVVRITLI
ncbi:MAG: hypothetical protein CMF82_00330 [Candidatus Marinimicrobia bacterium]|nr:hypothetical protein [Candidatus Neomarinimicrobiota bacterium]|tara:strand:- start:4686 stop:5396 length:711 start_codon:yes stop_codon:yes gene_type:complete